LTLEKLWGAISNLACALLIKLERGWAPGKAQVTKENLKEGKPGSRRFLNVI
jgi:hypothetical protein